ncbi:MAG: hypothetical protein ABI992_03600 [Chthoniobacterales bacterium]
MFIKHLFTLSLSAFLITRICHSQEAVSTEAITVTASADSLQQATPVGPYGQPVWTTERFFSNTRVYVRPPGTAELNQFWTPEFLRDGTVEHTFRDEIEIGLPHRFQLDLYQNWNIDGNRRPFYKGSSVEVRYALADWGKIPLNPTLYAEWNFNRGAPDVWEAKILLGETFCGRWNWAGNLTYEQETGGARGREIAMSQALSYAVIDRIVNVGVEMLFEHKTEAGSRGHPAVEFLIGPAFNVKPSRHTYLSVSPLFGTTGDSPRAQIFLAFGAQIWGGSGRDGEEVRAPASFHGR